MNLYLRAPSDLLEKSRSSSIVSLLAVTIMGILCIAEVIEYFAPPYESTLTIEPHRFGRLAVHLSLDMHNIPCSLVNVELKSAVFERKPPVDSTNDFVRKHLAGDACRITGSALLDKSAGHLRVFFMRKQRDGSKVVPEEELNLSHNVRYLSFTDDLDVSSETKVSGPSGGYHPLVSTDGESAGQRLWEMYGPQDDQTAGVHSESNQHHDYNLQLVPVISGAGALGYQYTWTENTYSVDWERAQGAEVGEPSKPLAVTFHFQLSPMTIKSEKKVVTFMGLMMRLWSIVGGVYVMCMLLDRVLWSGSRFAFGSGKKSDRFYA